MDHSQWQDNCGNCYLWSDLIGSFILFYLPFYGLQHEKRIDAVPSYSSFFQYFYVLIQEIVKANLCVLKIIISPEIQPEPALVYFGTDLQSELSKVILANSITLTPGTITVSLEDNRFCVHCLDRELAEGMENSVFVELLKKMEAEERKWR